MDDFLEAGLLHREVRLCFVRLYEEELDGRGIRLSRLMHEQ